jgi:hypothetical protein
MYAEIAPVKFAGITLGISSDQLVELLCGVDYSAYDKNEKPIKNVKDFSLLINPDSVGYFENPEIMKKGLPNINTYICDSKILGLSIKGEESIYAINYHSDKSIIKYIYDDWVVSSPLFLFSEGKLIHFSGRLLLLKEDINDLISNLNKTYIKNGTNNNLPYWISNNTLIELFYDIGIHKLGLKYNNQHFQVGFRLRDIKAYNDCAINTQLKYKEQSDKLIQERKGKVYIYDTHLGMSKDSLFKNIKIKYPEQYAKILKSISNEYNPINSVADTNLLFKMLPDSFTIRIPFRDRDINIRYSFWKGKVIEIITWLEVYNYLDDAIKQFISKHKNHLSYYKSKPKEFPREYATYILGDDSLQIGTQMGGSSIYLQSRKGIQQKEDDINKYQINKLEQMINSLSQNIIDGRLFGLKIGDKVQNGLKIGINEKVRYVYKLSNDVFSSYVSDAKLMGAIHSFIDLNTTNKSLKYDYYVLDTQPFLLNIMAREVFEGDTSTYFKTHHVEVLCTDEYLSSISAGLSLNDIMLGKDKRNKVIEVFTEILNSKFGICSRIEYLGRKSSYWRIGDNLFELVIVGEMPWYPGRSLRADEIFISLRKYEQLEVLSKYSKKKSILDKFN